MDKFSIGQRVICVAPHPNGLPGFWGRRGVVVAKRGQGYTYQQGKGFYYAVEFEGERWTMAALEWELLPDTPEGLEEVKRTEELTA
jgi:hypothetical protein